MFWPMKSIYKIDISSKFPISNKFFLTNITNKLTFILYIQVVPLEQNMGPKKQKRKQNKILKVNDNERHNCIIHFEEYGDDQKFLQISEERFTKLRKLAVLKSNQQGGSSEAHLSACNQITDYFEAGQGYHRKCYKKFTRNTECLVSIESETCTDTKLRQRTNEDIEKKSQMTVIFVTG